MVLRTVPQLGECDADVASPRSDDLLDSHLRRAARLERMLVGQSQPIGSKWRMSRAAEAMG